MRCLIKKPVIIGAVLLLIVCGGIGYFFFAGSALDRSGKAYVDEAVPAITTAWLPHELVKRESPAFLKATSDAQLVKLFDAFRRLGALKSYGGCKGEATVTNTPNAGKVITGIYVAQTTFEKGQAQIKVSLIQLNGQWKIQGFNVDSPVFISVP